jgi:hypothetical protein
MMTVQFETAGACADDRSIPMLQEAGDYRKALQVIVAPTAVGAAQVKLHVHAGCIIAKQLL